MAPTTIKMDTKELASAPSPQGLLRLTTSGGTEVNLQVEQDSPKPLFIRGASGHFEPQVDLDPEPAKLDIPWPAFFSDKKPRVPSVAPETGEEFACHKSQCSTEDPNEEATPPLSPRNVSLATVTTNTDTAGALEWKPGVPTKGSAGHSLGKCKPCAFVFKDGCESGVNCEFCHLCKPGEKKRRKKERRTVRHYELEQKATARKPQFECELQHEQDPPPPPPPMYSSWLNEEPPVVYQTPGIEYTLGSREWQLAKSESRTRAQAQNSNYPSTEVWYPTYQGWYQGW